MTIFSSFFSRISSVKISNKVSKIISPKNGVVEGISAIEIGKISLRLGAGRKELTDKIDFGVGISLNVQIGDKIKKGDVIATIYGDDNYQIDNFDSVFKII